MTSWGDGVAHVVACVDASVYKVEEVCQRLDNMDMLLHHMRTDIAAIEARSRALEVGSCLSAWYMF